MVKLSAATSKLTKIARRWFDLSPGYVNKSWDAFKNAITRRFKRRILFNVVMQRVENRKWNFATETFQEYAIDKLAMIQLLKLQNDDAIHLLINGINSLSIKNPTASTKFEKAKDCLPKGANPRMEAIQRSAKARCFLCLLSQQGSSQRGMFQAKEKDQHQKSSPPPTIFFFSGSGRGSTGRLNFCGSASQ
ncbi:hypothetical protein RF55_12209 [Lasius niger]|uniref:Uncharacterized protein n=1 Tax=Lasius niger TaxID=67767 RepID=A0A0J7N6K8_LASNI|nr:hypothetical protein RF55_12209 [Lasius niger]